MKTRLTIFLTGLLLFTGKTIQAQTNYYDTTKTFYENGYVYQCDVDEASGMVTLYNRENNYTYDRYANKDGSQVSSDILLGEVALIEDDNWTRKTCSAIADNVFSSDERKRVRDEKYGVAMIIDTSTGKVIGVHFTFLHNNAFGTIPVSTFRKLELELKQKIWFTLTPEGKQLTFIQIGWMHTVSRWPLILD